MEVMTAPQLAVPTAEDAIAVVNRWLHREVGLAVHVTAAAFDPETFFWHLPIELAYPSTGTLGVVGDCRRYIPPCRHRSRRRFPGRG